MKRWLRTLIALPMLCAAGAGTAPPTRDELMTLRDRENCELQQPGRVVYAGDSSMLAACLARLGLDTGPIAELRITSRGGDAWATLEIARALRGRLDRVVIDGLCASSCANYLLPSAKRVRVEPRSYVLLHGSPNQRDAIGQREEIRRQVREIAKSQAWGKDMSEAELEKMAQQSIDQYEAGIAAHIPVQQAFARDTLSCDDWLDVWAHFGGQAPPKGMAWLLVTPEMAARCLKGASIETFWAPEAQDAFSPELGFFRARK